MSFFSRYMGTKRVLASLIAQEIFPLRAGPVLDLFSGMSAVGHAVGVERPVWGNDVQHFASQVMQSIFVDGDTPELMKDACRCITAAEEAKAHLESELSELLATEASAESAGRVEALLDSNLRIANSRTSGKLAALSSICRETSGLEFYCSFSALYSGAYFSLSQSIQIDSIRWAMDRLLREGSISTATWRRLLICLGKACLSASSTTGHFAQFLRPKESSVERYLSIRSADTSRLFLAACASVRPVGTASWRAKNNAFRDESNSLLRSLLETGRVPAVVYCDPPYTADHYSRFYHVLETLVLADLPEVRGSGLYRDDRHVSDFSIKTKVVHALSEMIENTARVGADIVISYPAVGLLGSPREVMPGLLETFYSRVLHIKEFAHSHSSLGASKGYERLPVTELLFVATTPR